jgi:hypothetical protein
MNPSRRHPGLSGRWLARLYGCVLGLARRKIGRATRIDIYQIRRGILGYVSLETSEEKTRTYVMEEMLGGKRRDPGAMRTLLLRMRSTLTRMPVQR